MDTFENNDQIPREMEDMAPQETAPQAQEQPVAEITPEAPAVEPQPEPPVQESTAYHGVGVGQQDITGRAAPQPRQGYGVPPQYGQYQQPGYYQQPRYQGGYYQNGYQQPGYQQSAYRQANPQGYYQQPNAYAVRTPPQPPVQKKAKKKGGFWKSVLAAVLILALVGGSCFATAAIVDRSWQERAQEMSDTFAKQFQQLQDQIDHYSNDATGTSVSGTSNTSAEGMTPAQVYAQNVPSVVAISSTVTAEYYGQTTTGTSTGSGFILTEDGYVVTNYHVVEGATSVTVTTNDGEEYSATVVGGDSTNDVAVLKVNASGLPAVTIGSSSSLIVGDQVVAIGNPLGELTNTLTVGYVSAKDRMVTTDGFAINMLQTDAAINSGNSGGALFNMKGEVVGITTAKYSGESSSGATIEGIGFAIPIDDVYNIVEDLIQYGYVTGAYLGVSVSDMNATSASYYGLPMGAYVREVTPGYAAEKAGLKEKDIIVAVGDHEVNGVTSLSRALRYFKAGDTTIITVYRSGVRMEMSITLDAKPDTQPSATVPESGAEP